MRALTLASALALMTTLGSASAATLTFGDYISTNGADKLSPLVTVSDDPVGSFLVTVSHTGTSDGHLNLIGFDVGGPISFVGTDVRNVKNDGVPLVFTSQCVNNVGAGNYCFDTSTPLGGNSNNLNGNLGEFDQADLDIVLAFFNNDAIADNGSALTFNLSDLGGFLKLSDFRSVGLRYQSANNRAGSDKLAGFPDDPNGGGGGGPNPIPLPAGLPLLLGGLGLYGIAKRMKARKA